jgi:hypothetical protein
MRLKDNRRFAIYSLISTAIPLLASALSVS